MGLGIVTWGREGSGITVGVAAVGTFVRLDASSPKTVDAKLTLSQIPTSNCIVVTFVYYSSFPPP